ncbi:MAG TPA: serine hydrolase domain-containing protein [Spirochaetales bacterium]|nr:serine hydrolase domain-containing protein [Spirochaetales bacterium]
MRWFKRLLPLLLMVAACAIILFLPDRGPEKYNDLGSLFKNEWSRQATIGYSVAACRNGTIIYQESFGVDGQGQKLTKRTVMPLGPSSSVLSGALLCSLSQQGKVNLDEDIQTYIPSSYISTLKQIPTMGQKATQGTAPKATKPISILNLADSAYTTYDAISLQRLLSGKAANKKPRINGSLSSELLIAAMESSSGYSFEALLQSNILIPLGMYRTTSMPNPNVAVGTGHLFGLSFPYSSLANPTNLNPAVVQDQGSNQVRLPTDNVFSTTEDMIKFLLYVTSPPSRGIPSLPSNIVPSLYQPLTPSGTVGFGWQIYEEKGDRIVYQGGAANGFSSRVVIWPERNAGIVIMAPQGGIVESGILMPLLTEAAQNIMFSGSSPRLFHVHRALILVGTAILLYCITLFLQTSNADSWAKTIVEHQETGARPHYYKLVAVRTALGGLIRFVLLTGAPLLTGAVIGRTLSYFDFLALEPGSMTLLVLAFFAGFLRNVARLVWLRRMWQK